MSFIADDTRVARSQMSRSQVSWSAIAAGAVTATALGVILLAFGAGVGLSVTSPYDGEGWSPVAYVTAAGLWVLWVHVLSFYCGGYVTGRLHARPAGVSDHEADVGDTLHGAVTWGAGVLIATVLALASVGGASAAGNGAAPASVTASVSRTVADKVTEGARQEAVSGSPEAQAASLDKRRADVVRTLTIISAFVTAASMFAGVVAAIFGAVSGGHHRDAAVELPFFKHRRVVIKRGV